MAARFPCRRRGPRRAGPGDAGFTLIEVLAAGAILSALSLCLVNAWAVFDRMSLDLVLRQKAAFVLNGEMERLWTVHTSTSFGASNTSRAAYSVIPGLPSSSNSATRYSYTSVTGVTDGFTTSDPAQFGSQQAPYAKVFLGTGSPPLNWVWLDPQRTLVARLSWLKCQIKTPDIQSCWTGATSTKPPPKPPPGATPFLCYRADGGATGESCVLMTAVLEYPFAFNNGSPSAIGQTRTLTLSTIVGRRM